MARITVWNATEDAATATVSTAGYEAVTFSVGNAAGLASAIEITLENGEPVTDFDTGVAVELSATTPQVVLQGGPAYTFTMANPTGAVSLDAYATGAQGM